jgi:hypothetical protein
MIEPIMPYANVDIFQEKGSQIKKKKVWEPLNFIKKLVKNKQCQAFRATSMFHFILYKHSIFTLLV